MKSEVLFNSITDIRKSLIEREFTSTELVKSAFERIKKCDTDINSFVRLHEEYAFSRASQVDDLISRGDISKPLLGVPIAVKDNFLIKGLESTCCSKSLSGYIAPYSSTVVERLEDLGAIILGNTNMDEFAMGGTTETSCYGPTLNPWNKNCSPGGSSGGASASVCAGFVPAAIGTDTGGSIRQPASFCGLVGVKPTYGRVSRYGVISYASSFDQVGPITRTVRDGALLLSAIAGRDDMDSTSVVEEVERYENYLDEDISGVTIGLPKEIVSNSNIDPEISSSLNSVIKIFKDLGANFKEISLPNLKYAVASYYIMATSEASSNLARYDGIRYGLSEEREGYIDSLCESRKSGFGQEVKRRILLGTFALSSGYYDEYYRKASKVRRLVKNDMEKAFKDCDVMLWPVAPMLPIKLGELLNDPLKMYLADVFTLTSNLVGLPAISFPGGFSKSGLPIGVQLYGNFFEEKKLFNIAHIFEEKTKWYKEKPSLC